MAKGNNDDGFIFGRIAIAHIEQLMIAYKERYDRDSFFQNLILDNLLLVDVYNRAKRLKIEVEKTRVVFIIEIKTDNNDEVLELLKNLYTHQSGDHVTAVDEKQVILIKSVDSQIENMQTYLDDIAKEIVDTVSAEAMVPLRVAYGNMVLELFKASKSYKEAKMALEVGRIFYLERSVLSYKTLGIGRLIYQLPVTLCKMFMDEIFGGEKPSYLDEETLVTINKFFENNLNVSETSRQLFIHRNTLVYRLERLQKHTGT